MDDVILKSGKTRRRRGDSPRGDFDAAKHSATTAEQARVEAARRKTAELREARLGAVTASGPSTTAKK